MENWQHREAGAAHSLLKQRDRRAAVQSYYGTPMIGHYRRELQNGDNLNLDIGRSVTCGVGGHIFLYGSKAAAQKMRRSHRTDQNDQGRVFAINRTVYAGTSRFDADKRFRH
jgi:hypothetical protein